RQWTKQDRIHDTKDCSVCSYAQSDRGHRDHRKQRLFEKHSQTKTKILKHFVLQSTRLQDQGVSESPDASSEKIHLRFPIQLVQIGTEPLSKHQLGLPFLSPVRAQLARYNHPNEPNQRDPKMKSTWSAHSCLFD